MFQFRPEYRKSRTVTLGLGSRILGTLFFLVFLSAGLAVISLGVWESYRTIRAWSWPAAPCVIEASSVEDVSGDYRFKVRYRYEVAGKTWHSDRITIANGTSTEYAPQARMAAAYPVGATTRCFVDPARLSEAVLRQGNLWILAFTLFGLPFVALGGSGIYTMWRQHAPIEMSRAGWVNVRGRRVFEAVFLGSFALAGAAGVYYFTVRVALDVHAARRWTVTPCVVVSSRVQSRSGDKGTTYSVDILYSYSVNGREYRSATYSFLGGSSSGYDAKAAIVRGLPPGARTVCYVNPDDPTDAVLERGYTWDMLWGGIPLVFLVFGVGGLVLWVRWMRRRTQPTHP